MSRGGRGLRFGCAMSVSALLALAAFSLPVAAHATYAGQNGRIAFVADSGDGVELYTVRPDGGGLRQLTHLRGDAVAPDWSPDGRSIVLEEDLPDDAGAVVEVVRADGHGLHVLSGRPGVFDGAPSFTPDGTHIVFARFEPDTGRTAIWRMNRSGVAQTEITKGTGFAVSTPEVSPDGRTISFIAYDATGAGPGLYRCALDGSRLRELVPPGADLVDKQDWSPDGRLLAASDHHDHRAPGLSENLFTVRADGTHRKYLTHFSGGDVNAVMGSFAPDGRSIALRIEDHGRYGLYRLDRRGGSMRAILPLSDLKPRYIDWGPSTSPAPDTRPVLTGTDVR